MTHGTCNLYHTAIVMSMVCPWCGQRLRSMAQRSFLARELEHYWLVTIAGSLAEAGLMVVANTGLTCSNKWVCTYQVGFGQGPFHVVYCYVLFVT